MVSLQFYRISGRKDWAMRLEITNRAGFYKLGFNSEGWLAGLRVTFCSQPRSFRVFILPRLQGWSNFVNVHTKIMNWGFNMYSNKYLNNTDDLLRSGLSPNDWALS